MAVRAPAAPRAPLPPPAPAAEPASLTHPHPTPPSPHAVRKANIAAMEKTLWEEELSMHAGPDAKQAEASVYRQRKLDWEFRENPGGYVYAMAQMKFPFIANAAGTVAAPAAPAAQLK